MDTQATVRDGLLVTREFCIELVKVAVDLQSEQTMEAFQRVYEKFNVIEKGLETITYIIVKIKSTMILLRRNKILWLCKTSNIRFMHNDLYKEAIMEDPIPITEIFVPENSQSIVTETWMANLVKLKEKYKLNCQQGKKTISTISEDNNNVQDTILVMVSYSTHN